MISARGWRPAYNGVGTGGVKYRTFLCDLAYHEGDTPLRRRPSDCPNSEEHEPEPEGYIAWHEWAKSKGRTHVQARCPGCGLFAIWRAQARAQAREWNDSVTDLDPA